MTKVQSSYSYRKWGVGLGVVAAAVLSGYLALKPTKKIIIPPSTQPAAKVLEPKPQEALEKTIQPTIKVLGPKPQKAIEKTIEFAEAVERARLANFDRGIEPKSKDEPLQEEIPQELKPKMGLKQLIAELNDDPIPTLDIWGNEIEVKIDREGVCSGANGTDVAFYNMQGGLLGYKLVGNSEAPYPYFGGDLFYRIVDDKGKTIGFRYRATLGANLPFVSRSGNLSGIKESITTWDKGNIYSEEGNPIGRTNEEGQFVDQNGTISGKLDTTSVYLPLWNEPYCERTSDGKANKLLKFSSFEEFKLFEAELTKQLGYKL